jgi:hypothetical protein
MKRNAFCVVLLIVAAAISTQAGAKDGLSPVMRSIVDVYTNGNISRSQLASVCSFNPAAGAEDWDNVPFSQARAFCDAYLAAFSDFGAQLGTVAESQLVGAGQSASRCGPAPSIPTMRIALNRKTESTDAAAVFISREILKCVG